MTATDWLATRLAAAKRNAGPTLFIVADVDVADVVRALLAAGVAFTLTAGAVVSVTIDGRLSGGVVSPTELMMPAGLR